ncbi:MAG: flagellar hook capping FlgD N-terminal domain-containing protein [Burkholderia sp.]
MDGIRNDTAPAAGDQAAPPPAPAGAEAGGLSQMFTQLLVAQIRNQDPLAPMEPGQFVTQLAQMSQVEAMQSLASQGAANAAMQESMLVVTLGAQVGSDVMVATDSVELADAPLAGAFTLASSAADVSLRVSGPDGVEHTIALGPQQAGNVDFTLDPAEHDLPPGRYTVRVATDAGAAPRVEVKGVLQGVRLGADGRVVLSVGGVGERDTADITRFLGRPDLAGPISITGKDIAS